MGSRGKQMVTLALMNNNTADVVTQDSVKDSDLVDELASSEPSVQYTKTGAVRKRRKMEEPLQVRQRNKLDNCKQKHSLKTPCVICKKNCNSYFSNEHRTNINTQYWEMTFTEKRTFVACSITAEPAEDVKRHRGSANSRRQKTYKYFLKSTDGSKIEVCKHFFLTTLGYTKGNDRIVQDCFLQKKRCNFVWT
ncbi:hypothetical protein RI129_003096 [Pyrocoelia pectoralis]|uniref:Uncharacterized protein n=1 Tax=Pyrocoelia pectoralis TaxID=417401 RepID=A0AAN7VNL4_9COLE